MIKYLSLILIIAYLCFTFAGCKKKESMSPFQSQLPDSNQTITITSGDIMPEVEPIREEVVETKSIEVEAADSIVAPRSEHIQIALKNAGYYAGNIDGKIGPMSKKAIVEFQKANDLEPDGKVGPKTWSKLKKYLSSATTSINN
jgi:peptidoglycan hydrolase-like protein with peptidoglycan-binding domain